MLWFKLKPWFEQNQCFCVQTLFYTKSCFTQKLSTNTTSYTKAMFLLGARAVCSLQDSSFQSWQAEHAEGALKCPISIPLMSHQYPIKIHPDPKAIVTMWANITGPEPKAFSDHGFISNGHTLPNQSPNNDHITLWWTNIAIENGHRNSGFSHEKWVDLSIANC